MDEREKTGNTYVKGMNCSLGFEKATFQSRYITYARKLLISEHNQAILYNHTKTYELNSYLHKGTKAAETFQITAGV